MIRLQETFVLSWGDSWQYYCTKRFFFLIEGTALFVVFMLCLLFAVYCCRPTSKTTYLNPLAL